MGSIDNRPQIPQNTLFRNRGDGTFEEIAAYAGVTASEWSWQPIFLDVDLDGWEDIIISTGFAARYRRHGHDGKNAQTATLRHIGPAEARAGWQAGGAFAAGTKAETLYQGNLLPEPLTEPIVAYRNQGNLKFQETGPAWGFDQAAHS